MFFPYGKLAIECAQKYGLRRCIFVLLSSWSRFCMMICIPIRAQVVFCVFAWITQMIKPGGSAPAIPANSPLPTLTNIQGIHISNSFWTKPFLPSTCAYLVPDMVLQLVDSRSLSSQVARGCHCSIEPLDFDSEYRYHILHVCQCPGMCYFWKKSPCQQRHIRRFLLVWAKKPTSTDFIWRGSHGVVSRSLEAFPGTLSLWVSIFDSKYRRIRTDLQKHLVRLSIWGTFCISLEW